MKTSDKEPQPAAPAEPAPPAEGGSYVYDEQTGVRTLVERTKDPIKGE